MAKQKKKFYEEMEFDDVQYAMDIVNEYQHKLNKVERGLFVAIIVSAVNIFAFWLNSQGVPLNSGVSNILGIVVFCGAIVSYVLGGGILTALRWAWRIGAFLWYIFIFPLDLMMVILGFGFSLIAFFCVPVIFVYMNYRQIKMDYKAAKKYLSYYKVKTQPAKPKVSSSQARVQTNGNRSYMSDTRQQVSGSRSYGSTTGAQNMGSRSYGNTARTQTSESGTNTSRVRLNSDGTRSYR